MIENAMTLEEWAEQFRVAIKDASAKLAGVMSDLRRSQEARRAALSPEQRDKVSQARYDHAVARERRTGKYHVDILIHHLEQDLLRQGIDVRKP